MPSLDPADTMPEDDLTIVTPTLNPGMWPLEMFEGSQEIQVGQTTGSKG